MSLKRAVLYVLLGFGVLCSAYLACVVLLPPPWRYTGLALASNCFILFHWFVVERKLRKI